MARIDFDREPDSTPFDEEQTLTAWRLVGGSSYPAPTPGLTGPARAFDGTAGYEAEDDDVRHMGLRAVTVRALVQIDFDELAGAGPVTLLSRGQGGPTAGEFWAWDLRVVVAADALSAAIRWAWQDETGAVAEHELGTITRPPADAWMSISATRETPGETSYLRLVVDGELVGEVETDDAIPATPGQRVTLGCRRTGAAFDQFFAGAVEIVELLEHAVTPLQERHAYREHIELPAEALEDVRGYWFESDLRLRDSLYASYRLRPLAELRASVAAAIERREQAGLPDTAYGERIAAWEQALRLTGSDRLTLAERQQRATAAMALVEGIGVEFLRSYAARVLGVADVTSLLESANDVWANLSDTAVETIDSQARERLRAWRVYGNIETVWDETNEVLRVSPVVPSLPQPSFKYRQPLPESNIDGGGFCEIAVPADVRVCADVESDPTVDSTEENWTGLMFRTGVHVQYIVLEEGVGLVVHVHDGFGTQTREEGGLLPASASLRWQVALSHDDSGLLIRVRAFEQIDDPEAWTEFRPTTAVLPSAPEWFGFATNDPVGAGEDPALVVHAIRIQSPSTPARRWTAIADVPADPEFVIELLARKNRASSLAGWSRDAEALADSDKTFADYTPTLRL